MSAISITVMSITGILNLNYGQRWGGGGGWSRNLNIGSPRLKMEPGPLVYLREEYKKK